MINGRFGELLLRELNGLRLRLLVLISELLDGILGRFDFGPLVSG